MKDTLFCIHTSGMDDIVPVHSMAEAVKAAAYLNAEHLDFHTREKDAPPPCCFVAPMVWPGDADSHAKVLAECKADAKDRFGGMPHWMCA